MKSIKLLLSFSLVATLFTSCYREVIIDNYEPVRVDYVNNNPVPALTVNQILNSYELWYVDINATLGYGETPFLQKAFTISFRNGVVYANNNIVGIGNSGNGFGINVGTYDAYNMILDVYHDIDGFETFDVYQIDSNTIELYNPNNDTSYFLEGYQRSNFDYDMVFYDNIHYFLQEYQAWEKVYTSAFGAINEFDNENYLQFLAGGNDSEFRSSQNMPGLHPYNINWHFTGLYGVGNVSNNMLLKTLTLNYDAYGNEFFELSVMNDSRIRLYHPASQTTYEFVGSGYIQYLKPADSKSKTTEQTKVEKKRKFKEEKKENPRKNTRV